MKNSKNAFSFSLPPKNVYFFCSSEIDHVVGAVNAIVKTSMEKLAAIWDECGYNNTNVQQRCEAVQMHVQVNVVLAPSLI
jgi:hypothetical protein